MWIWQQPAWPDFDWDQKVIAPLLREAHFNQGLLLGRMGLENQQQATLDTLLANIVHSSAIEGEKLNAFSVRSSLANKLGIKDEQQYPTTEQTNGLADMMIDAITQLDQPLSIERILRWHEWLFPAGYTLFNPVQVEYCVVTRPCKLFLDGLINQWFILKHLPGTSLKRNYSISSNGLMIRKVMLN